MKISRPKTEKWHNYDEGDVARPIRDYYKKGFWKRYDRKRFLKLIEKPVSGQGQ